MSMKQSFKGFFYAQKSIHAKKTFERMGIFMSTKTRWQIPFFVNVSEEQFSQEIRALGFNRNAQGVFLWQEGNAAAIILQPLRTNGGVSSSGYRFYYEGNRTNDCLAVIMLLLNMYQGSYITGVECVIEGVEQEAIIRESEKNNYKRGSMSGLYQNGRVSIVCMPQNTVLQVRRKGIRRTQLESILNEIAETKNSLLGQVFDLFTATSQPESELLYA
ncbi:hypothetical protein D7X33_17700 [Butyricicoccus sp. 1XD8-22]|nr:hypothetical protein D7X33_17700 [Butyricicoccus sp. 1XD8-22]